MTMVSPRRRGRRPDVWRSYAQGTDGAHFAEFCRDYLVQSVDEWAGEPLILEAWQRRLFGEALAWDRDHRPVWESVVILAPRKNGKTAMLAAYAVYRLVTSDGSPEILLAAASDKQAGRLFDAAATFIRRNEELSAMCRIRDYVGEIVLENGEGRVFRLSSDPKRLHGYNPSLVVCDELAQWTTDTLERAYAALTSGGGARKSPQVFTITTAGEARDRHDTLLGHILDGALSDGDVEAQPGLQIARHHAARMLVYNHEAPTDDPRDVRAMKLANPASWITTEFLGRQAANPELTDAQVLQLHGCVWAAGQKHWLPAGAWDGCVDPRREWPADREPVVLGFDGSYDNDSTGLVGATLDGHVFVVGVWERPDTRGEWIVPRDEVMDAVEAAMQRWQVLELTPDPNGWHREVADWEQRYGGVVVRWNPKQINLVAAACSQFYTGVVNHQLSHDGDRTLARHLANATVKETVDGAFITKDGRNSPRKIDLAYAAVIAYSRALFHSQNVGGGVAALSDEEFEAALNS